ncbi:hypothetical protein B0H15DRAFT_508285 [Mycena belliarum]|uniref:Uncharacterized protein n=1 Tax=Mycena belliarum TaxID=1033014 RepID=A0AAD6UIK9_9AGAR|nr:hypothetical protein B0H15DRAFT_508285 [Mycena belliae]
MPPSRADAAHIAPYLTHIVTHHGQLTLVPPDSEGRRRKAKQTKSPRSMPREEPVRFNSGPNPASPSSPRQTRRPSRTEQQYLHDDIPDYPPPSFQEAISSTTVSLCPSTTTLRQFTSPQTSRHTYNSDSDSGSDDASHEITESYPSRGPTTERSSLRSQPLPRGRGVLDSDPDDLGLSASNVRAHRRRLSLSPLRTLFPSRNVRDFGPASSAQSTPSQSLAFSRSSPFFRSTTSLRLTSTAPLPPPSPSSAPSIRSENFLGPRRFFSHKGKERTASEALDSWEIVESQLPGTSTIPTPTPDGVPPHAANTSPGVPTSIPVTPAAIHPLSERDRQIKSRTRIPPAASPSRERERELERHPRPPPPSLSPTVLAPVISGAGPPIITVRTKKPPPPPPPKKKSMPVPSPLRGTDGSGVTPELDLERAVLTPLPLTPVAGSPTSPSAFFFGARFFSGRSSPCSVPRSSLSVGTFTESECRCRC